MIPKKIHYCWFGRGELPAMAKKCIESWKKYCHDYEIIQWNEDNFDINAYPYAKYCLENRKFAFLSDYVRLVVVKEHGGFYFDTDVEIIKSIDDLLDNGAVYGFESNDCVNTGQGFGAIANHKSVIEMIRVYDELVPDENGAFPLQACPALNTMGIDKFGLVHDGEMQSLEDILVLPSDYMNPLDNATGIIKITYNTYSIHHYQKSWISPKQRLISKIARPFHRIFGDDCFAWLKGKKK